MRYDALGDVVLEAGEVPLLDRLLVELAAPEDSRGSGILILCRAARSGRHRALGSRDVDPDLVEWWEEGTASEVSEEHVEQRADSVGLRARRLEVGPSGRECWFVSRDAVPRRTADLLTRVLELADWIAGERRHLASMVEARTAEIERTRHELQGVDPETGLTNRRDFDRAFDREWRRAARLRRPLALLLVEFDGPVTRPLAGRVVSVPSRATDLVARFDARRLVVLLPDTEPRDAESLGRRLAEVVEDAGVSVGVGGVTPRVGFLEPSQLLKISLAALERALGEGPGAVALEEIDDVEAMTGRSERDDPSGD